MLADPPGASRVHLCTGDAQLHVATVDFALASVWTQRGCPFRISQLLIRLCTQLRLDAVDAALAKGVGGVPLSELSDDEAAALCCALQRVGRAAVQAGELPDAARGYARMLDLAQARGELLGVNPLAASKL